MTDSATLLALAKRVEAAGEGSRELDALITVTLDLRADWLRGSTGEIYFAGEMIGDNPVIRFRDECIKRRGPGNPPSGHCPHFTASLDAAMGLAPEGWAFGTGTDFLVPGPPGWAWATKGEDYELVRAATPALALTAAALRSLAAQQGAGL